MLLEVVDRPLSVGNRLVGGFAVGEGAMKSRVDAHAGSMEGCVCRCDMLFVLFMVGARCFCVSLVCC